MSCNDLFLESDLRILKDSIYFVGSGAKTTENFGLDSDRSDDILFISMCDKFFELFFFIPEQKFIAISVLFEEIGILATFMLKNDASGISSNLLILLTDLIHERISLGIIVSISHLYNGLKYLNNKVLVI